jgi:hypothetical protein
VGTKPGLRISIPIWLSPKSGNNRYLQFMGGGEGKEAGMVSSLEVRYKTVTR